MREPLLGRRLAPATTQTCISSQPLILSLITTTYLRQIMKEYDTWFGARNISNSSIVCFASGTLIETERGAVQVQCLRVTDKVITVAARMFGYSEVLVPAKLLVGLAGIEYPDDDRDITYCHFLCDRHEVVFAEGAQTESFFTGPQALQALHHPARAEVFAIFPELSTAPDEAAPTSARPLFKGRNARRLVAQHKANARSVFIGSVKHVQHEFLTV